MPEVLEKPKIDNGRIDVICAELFGYPDAPGTDQQVSLVATDHHSNNQNSS
jgi:hypothetical protein